MDLFDEKNHIGNMQREQKCWTCGKYFNQDREWQKQCWQCHLAGDNIAYEDKIIKSDSISDLPF